MLYKKQIVRLYNIVTTIMYAFRLIVNITIYFNSKLANFVFMPFS